MKLLAQFGPGTVALFQMLLRHNLDISLGQEPWQINSLDPATLKGERMIVWTYASSTSWSHYLPLLPWQITMQDLQATITTGVASGGFAGYPTTQNTGVWAVEPIHTHRRSPPRDTSVLSSWPHVRCQGAGAMAGFSSPSSAVFPGVSSCKSPGCLTTVVKAKLNRSHGLVANCYHRAAWQQRCLGFGWVH